jgi:hypothetical protein
MCDAAADHSHERFISVTLHDRRVSFTLAKFPVNGRFDDFCALGEELSETIRKILEGKCLNRDE